MLRFNRCVSLVAVLAVALTSGQANADVLFQENFNVDTGVEFYTTNPANYGAWSEYSPTVTPFSNPSWSVVGGRLIGDTVFGAGSFPNTVVLEIPVPTEVVNGSVPLRIEFDAQILQGGGYDPPPANPPNYGSYMGVLTGNVITSLHSAAGLFGPIRYHDWNTTAISDPWYLDPGFVPDGVVHWDILIEQDSVTPGVDNVTVTISQGTNSYTDTWTTANDPSMFQFVDSKFRLGFYGDDGSGFSAVSLAYDNLLISTPTSSIPGDLNGDGFVGQDDLNIVLGDWGNMPPGDPRADPSGDGFVGQDDLNPVLADWGQGTPPVTLAGSSLSAAAVPEPSSILLLAMAIPCGLTLYRRRQRRTA